MEISANVGPGWQDIVERLIDELNEKAPGWKFLQCKEKFGTLRFYISSDLTLEEEDKIINKYEGESSRTCEECGKPGRLWQEAWLKTLCEDCGYKFYTLDIRPWDDQWRTAEVPKRG